MRANSVIRNRQGLPKMLVIEYQNIGGQRYQKKIENRHSIWLPERVEVQKVKKTQINAKICLANPDVWKGEPGNSCNGMVSGLRKTKFKHCYTGDRIRSGTPKKVRMTRIPEPRRLVIFVFRPDGRLFASLFPNYYTNDRNELKQFVQNFRSLAGLSFN